MLHPNQGELISGQQNGSIMMWDLAANKCSDSRVRSIMMFDVCLFALTRSLAHIVSSADSRWRGCDSFGERGQGCDAAGCSQQQGTSQHTNEAIERNNVLTPRAQGTCFLWRLRGSDTSALEPIQRIDAHKTYLLKCLISPNSQYVCHGAILVSRSRALGLLTLLSLARVLGAIGCWRPRRPTTRSRSGRDPTTLRPSRTPRP